MASDNERYQYPMKYRYSEELILSVPAEETICFAQWCGPHKVIFGHRLKLYVRNLIHSTTHEDPLEHCGKPNAIDCMMSNPSQTMLAVGYKSSVLIYDLPSLNYISKIADRRRAIIHYVCWLSDNKFATVNTVGEVLIRTWENGQFNVLRNRQKIPSFEVPGADMFKYHIFDYHPSSNKLLFLSHTVPILYMMDSQLTEIQTKLFDLPSYRQHFTGPKMIAVHFSNPYCFVAADNAIYAVDPATHEDILCFQCDDLCYSLSVAGNVITYSVGSDPKDIRFIDLDVTTNCEVVPYSLVSSVETVNSSAVSSNVLANAKTAAQSRKALLKPLIIVHAYSSDRVKLFCGGVIERNGLEGTKHFTHTAIWRVLRYEGIRQRKRPHGSDESDSD